jgi:ribulose-phosphate 3-epimerase
MHPIDICPTITAYDQHQYREQMERLKPFAKRIHIDLMDGQFAPTKSPGLETVWWLDSIIADIHLMYQKPMDELAELVRLKPSLVIIHAEAEVDHQEFTKALHEHGIKAGLAILSDTPVSVVQERLAVYDHALVFSGNLGHHGGQVDLGLTSKVSQIREACPDIEIGWDGGINDQNANDLIEAGVNVLNVGGFIQGSDDPANAYAKLEAAILA